MMTTMTQYLFDLGNTRLKYAPLRDDGRVGDVVAIAHDGEALPLGWDAALPTRFDAAALTTVGSAMVRTRLLDALTARCGQISIARTVRGFGDLRIAYPDPEALGTDRFLAMLGARARSGPAGGEHASDMRAALVVGIGTAITLDLIDTGGLHRGGRIAPSPALMRAALHGRAAQLPEHGGALVAFADNTLDALRSGCDGAALALIRDAMDAGTALLGVPPQLLLHGGGVDALSGLDADAVRAPALVLEGLAVWARMSA
jgi:type III pantothenate kinase